MQAPVPGPIDFQLVPYGKEHDAQTVQWLNNAELQRDFGLSRPVTQGSHRAWVERNPETIIWAITRNSRHLGNVLLDVNKNRRSAYLQIYLGEASARGKGIGGQALSCVLNFGFEEMGLHRIWLHTLPENQVAIKLYKKLGFVCEGTERDVIFRNGVFSDQYRWSILIQDWFGLKKATQK